MTIPEDWSFEHLSLLGLARLRSGWNAQKFLSFLDCVFCQIAKVQWHNAKYFKTVEDQIDQTLQLPSVTTVNDLRWDTIDTIVSKQCGAPFLSQIQHPIPVGPSSSPVPNKWSKEYLRPWLTSQATKKSLGFRVLKPAWGSFKMGSCSPKVTWMELVG